MIEGQAVDTRQIFQALRDVCLRGTAGLALATAGMAALFVAADLFGRQAAQSGASVINVGVAYVLTIHLLRRTKSASAPEPQPRFGAYFFIGIATGFTTLLGLLLLVLPGLFLAARWVTATPYLLDHPVSIGEAMRASWDATARSWKQFLIAKLVIFLPMVAALVVLFVWPGDSEAGQVALLPSIASNFFSSMWSVLAVALSVAAYRLMHPERTTLAAVFS